jgi:hypothetical protein
MTFINILKMRIYRHAPELSYEIDKSVAHLRLMSAMWYAASAAEFVCGIGAGVGAVCGIVSGIPALFVGKLPAVLQSAISFIAKMDISEGSVVMPFYIFSIISFIIAFYIRRAIKRFFHHQRLDEVRKILEYADQLDRDENSSGKGLMFRDIE